MGLADRPFELTLLATVLVLMLASNLFAQEGPSTGAAPLLAGPVSLYPAIVLRDVGFDSNIRDEPNDPKQDFTFTAEPHLRAVLPFGSWQLTGSATVGFVYYATYKSEQSINRRFEGRFEGTTSRLRPFLAAAFNHTRERSGYEIDARVLRQETTVSTGAEFKLTGITSLTGAYRHDTETYGEGEQVLDTVLANQLNHATDVASAGVRFAFTPLTTISLDVEAQRDRFESSTIRDANSVRIMPAVEFAPDAVVSGHAAAGFRQFSPLDPRVKEFGGFVGAAKLGYVLLDATRLAFEATRDVMYSFDPLNPYFVVTAGRLTVSQGVGGPFDLIAMVGHDRLQYQSVSGVSSAGRVDQTGVVGGGVGVRLGPSLRVTLIYDVTQRTSSDLDLREYRRQRVFGSATYGS